MSILIYKQRHRHPNYKKTPKGNYAHIGYIATRPGAVKNEGMRHGLFGKLEPGASKSLTPGRKPPAWFGSFPIVGSICIVVLSLFHLKRLLNWDCPIIKRGRTILTATF